MVERTRFWEPVVCLKSQWGVRLRCIGGLDGGGDRSQWEPMVRAGWGEGADPMAGFGCDGGRPPHLTAARSVLPREGGRPCGPVDQSLSCGAKLVERSQLRELKTSRKQQLSRGLRLMGDGRGVGDRSQTEPAVGVGLEQGGGEAAGRVSSSVGLVGSSWVGCNVEGKAPDPPDLDRRPGPDLNPRLVRSVLVDRSRSRHDV